MIDELKNQRSEISHQQLSSPSQYFGGQRDDFHESPLAQLTCNRTEDARADRLILIVDEHRRIAIEPDVAAIAPPMLLDGADDDGLHDLPLLDVPVRGRFLHR